jgi:epoxyqueuosine reductase
MSAFVSMNELRERARRLGLEIGASAPEPGPEVERYREWIEAGRHGEMAWLAKDPARRADARLVLEGAATVLSVAEPYFQGELPGPTVDRPRGRVARYALGDDYHEVLLPKLREIAASTGDEAARPYTDTGPVLEKPRAQRAGLGWVGKHSNAVSRRHGSWWFTGAVLTRAKLREDGRAAPMDGGHADHCGSCQRCLVACPTGAIRPEEPYQLDARRCISYLTIELRGPIPRELRPLIGTWVFGCDLCLDVCPWNRFAKKASEIRYMPRDVWLNPALEEMLGWDEARFRQATQRSPIRRAKRRGLLRNVAVALGNAGDRGAVPALNRCLEGESEALVRGHAAWALGQLGGAAARAALTKARRDCDGFVREELEAALDVAGR